MARFRRSRTNDIQVDENFMRLEQYLLYFHQASFAENGAAPATTAGDNVFHQWSVNASPFTKRGGLDQSLLFVDFTISNYADTAATLGTWEIKATHQDGTVLDSANFLPQYFFHQAANTHLAHSHTTHFGLGTNQAMKAGIWDLKIWGKCAGILNLKSDANDYNFMRVFEVPMDGANTPDF